VIELENQLAEERKIRLEQERKSIAVAPAKLTKSEQKIKTEKKPPLGPSNLSLPLLRISNFMPPPTPVQPKKTSKLPSVVSSHLSDGKESTSYESHMLQRAYERRGPWIF